MNDHLKPKRNRPSSTRTAGHDDAAASMPKRQSRLPQLFSVDEIAERFGVSTKTVLRWIQCGELRAHRLGRQYRIAEEDAIAFMAARRR